LPVLRMWPIRKKARSAIRLLGMIPKPTASGFR
jgi:hypothetical protein